jgi:bromodomain-containing protein 7/9
MDESFRVESADTDASQSAKPSSSGLTLILPALSALKQQSGIKKSKYKSTTPLSSVADAFGEVKRPPRPVKLKPLKEVLTRLIIQIKKYVSSQRWISSEMPKSSQER